MPTLSVRFTVELSGLAREVDLAPYLDALLDSVPHLAASLRLTPGCISPGQLTTKQMEDSATVEMVTTARQVAHL